MMKRFGLLAGMLLLLSGCCETPKPEGSLAGYWIERMPVHSEFVQGIRLDKEGSAASIGMHTLRYWGWERQGDRLLLKGRSVGNGQTIDFTDTLDIERLTADTLILGKYGRYRIEYHRATFGMASGCSLLDSLRSVQSGVSGSRQHDVLDVQIYEGKLPAETGSVPCEVMLFHYVNCGDGVFRLRTTPVAGSGREVCGRMYTLRGDASDRNATVLQLRSFTDSEIWNFRVGTTGLELLDASLSRMESPTGSVWFFAAASDR